MPDNNLQSASAFIERLPPTQPACLSFGFPTRQEQLGTSNLCLQRASSLLLQQLKWFYKPCLFLMWLLVNQVPNTQNPQIFGQSCVSEHNFFLPCHHHLAIRSLNFQEFWSKINKKPEAEDKWVGVRHCSPSVTSKDQALFCQGGAPIQGPSCVRDTQFPCGAFLNRNYAEWRFCKH